MIIVSNTSPLIGLAAIHRFELLQRIFGHIVISQAVYRESATEGREIGGAKCEVRAVAWIETRAVTDRAAVHDLLERLDEGEAETIILTREMLADWVLMDERKGRKILTAWGLKKIGTLGILLKAKQLGFLPVIRPEIELLCKDGFMVSQDVVDAVLRYAHEL